MDSGSRRVTVIIGRVRWLDNPKHRWPKRSGYVAQDPRPVERCALSAPSCSLHDERHVWPMLGHDLRRSGRYTAPRPNRPADPAVAVDGSQVELTWTDNSAVEDGNVVERSDTGSLGACRA